MAKAFEGEPSTAERKAPVAPSLELVRIAARGDSVATRTVLRAYAPHLGRVVRAVLGGAHPDFDDAVQLSLIGFVQALPAFRGDCDPLGYATVIALRTAVATRKRWRAQRARRDDTVDADAIQAEEPSPREHAAARHRKELLRDLLSELPPEQAEALAARVVLGWSLEEISAQSAAPLNTVRSRLRLAKEALRRKIEGDADLLAALEVHR